MPGPYTCERCGGTGKTVHTHVERGVCFKCGGDGKQAQAPVAPRTVPRDAPWSRKDVVLLGHRWFVVRHPDGSFEAIPATQLGAQDNPSGIFPRFIVQNGRVLMGISQGRSSGWGTPTSVNLVSSGHAQDVILRQMFGRISEHDAVEGTPKAWAEWLQFLLALQRDLQAKLRLG
jgi:hypothetical protein